MADSSVAPKRPAGRIAFAAGVGNFMEWFDFAIYGFFAVTLGAVFFPSQDPTVQLLSALAIFGVAFFMRPLGGVLLGAVGDRLGRRASLSASVLLMGISTSLVAALPTYEQVGILAPVLLVVLRCMQGLSAGGEWTGASSFLVEYAPTGRRALWGSVVSASAGAAAIGGGLVAVALEAWLTDGQLLAWGWRVAFLLAAPLAAVGLYVRLKLEETPVFQELQREGRVSKAPLREAVANNRRPITLIFFCAAVLGLGYYYLTTYVINFLTSEAVGMERFDALVATAAGLAIYAALCPAAGILTDKIGRRPTMIMGQGGLALVAIPAFLLMGTASIPLVILGVGVFATFEAMVNVSTVVLLVELFPARTRMSGGSIGYNVALAAVAGPGPLIAAALAASIAFPGAAAFYMVGVAVVSCLVLARYLPETLGQPLDDSDSSKPAGSEQASATALARN